MYRINSHPFYIIKVTLITVFKDAGVIADSGSNPRNGGNKKARNCDGLS
jgi:hypothetical protein